MPSFGQDDEGLTLTLELDREEDQLVDLTADGLGERCLAAAVDGMLGCFNKQQSPDGRRWADLAPSTVRARGSGDHIGVVSGKTLDGVRGGETRITRSSATWLYAGDRDRNGTFWRAYSLHRGNARNRQPARPWLGWTAAAKSQVADLLEAARP